MFLTHFVCFHTVYAQYSLEGQYKYCYISIDSFYYHSHDFGTQMVDLEGDGKLSNFKIFQEWIFNGKKANLQKMIYDSIILI